MKGRVMSNLLEIKEAIKKIYSKYETYIFPVVKFLIAFIAFVSIKNQLGYMTRINSMAILLIAALVCSFLPVGFIIFIAAVFILLHCYTLALEAAVVVFCLFLIMFLLFFRFTPKDALCVVLTPICFGLKIPYVMPLAMGLIGTPLSAITVACGTVVYYILRFISQNSTALGATDAGEATARLRMVIDGILGNKDMLITVVAFVFTMELVYVIRRLSIDHSWTIASIAGTIVNVMILLLGDLMYDTNVSVIGILLGSIVSLGIAMVLQFFVFGVDYSRTEKVQFEDDEYYYYVKAVPKMTVAAPEKTVKKINSQMGHAAHTGHTGAVASQPVRTGRNIGSQPRRTASVNNAGNSGQRTAPRSADHKNMGRQAASMTISTQNHQQEDDDFEEF